MHRSSETHRRHCRGAGQGPGRAHQPGKVADRDHPLAVSPERATGPSAMPRSPAASISSARASASTRSPRPDHRHRPGQRPDPADDHCWPTPPANGFRRTGRSVRSAKRPRPIGWEPLSPMPAAMRCSRWSGLPARTISMRRTCSAAERLRKPQTTPPRPGQRRAQVRPTCDRAASRAPCAAVRIGERRAEQVQATEPVA